MITPECIASNGSESAQQKALFCWAALSKYCWPELEFMYAVPNGGQRNIMTAARMKAEGVKRGVPDICLPVRRLTNQRSYLSGLYIEMKVGTNKLSEGQAKYKNFLENQGYFYAVCFTFEQARDAVLWYLDL